MKSTFAPSARRVRLMLFAVIMGVALPTLTISAPAVTAVAMAPSNGVAASAPPPGLSITLSDAKTQTQSKAPLTYVASVTNAGAAPIEGTLEITIPSYAGYAASTIGKKEGPDIVWPVTVDAGKSVSRKVKVTVGAIPRGEVRFTSIATLYSAGPNPQILVRTADPDGIRGVVDPAHSVDVKPAPENRPNQAVVLVIVILGAAVIVAVVFLTWIRRRRHARESSE